MHKISSTEQNFKLSTWYGYVNSAQVSSIAVWKTAEYANRNAFLLTDRVQNVCGNTIIVLGAEDDDGGGNRW